MADKLAAVSELVLYVKWDPTMRRLLVGLVGIDLVWAVWNETAERLKTDKQSSDLNPKQLLPESGYLVFALEGWQCQAPLDDKCWQMLLYPTTPDPHMGLQTISISFPEVVFVHL